MCALVDHHGWPARAFVCFRLPFENMDLEDIDVRFLEKYSGKLLILSVVAWVFVTFASHPAIANPEGPVVASEDAEQSLKAGRQALEQNALREALQHFRKAVAALPTSVPAQAYRGSVAEMLGEFYEALEAYTEAARLEPSVTHSYLLC